MTKSSSSMRLTPSYCPKPGRKAIRMSSLGSLRLLEMARGSVSVQHSRSSILRAPHVARATSRMTAVSDSCPAYVVPSPLLGSHVARTRCAARRRVFILASAHHRRAGAVIFCLRIIQPCDALRLSNPKKNIIIILISIRINIKNQNQQNHTNNHGNQANRARNRTRHGQDIVKHVLGALRKLLLLQKGP